MSDMSMPPPSPSSAGGVPPGYQPYQPAQAVVYSSWGARIGAYFLRALPGVVVFVPVWAAMIAVAASTSVQESDSGALHVQSEGPGVFTLLLLALAYALVILIQCRSMIQRGRLGYDFADAAIGQRLVSDGGLQPLGSGWSVFGRSLLHIVDAIPCYLGFLAPLWTAKKQTFADSIMKTVVVESKPSYSAKNLFVNTLTVWKPVIKS